MLRFFASLSFVLLLTFTCNAQINSQPGNHNKAAYGKVSPGGRKEKKPDEPGKAGKSRKKQAKDQKEIKKEYEKTVNENRKRAYDIQSPEVKARMKQNEKDIKVREKDKKKSRKADSKKAGKKYL